MTQKTEQLLTDMFTELTKASARKKVYAKKAGKIGRQDIGHLLLAIAESEAVQARRLFNLIRGRIDTSENYLQTAFEGDISSIIDEYSMIQNVTTQSDGKAIPQVLSQLKASEKRLRSFYSKEKKDVTVADKETYHVCKFCGYLAVGKLPEKCPICGASQEAFRKIDD